MHQIYLNRCPVFWPAWYGMSFVNLKSDVYWNFGLVICWATLYWALEVYNKFPHSFLSIRVLFQYKDCPSRYGDYHYKDKTVIRPSYLYNGNPCVGKMASWYQSGPPGSYLNKFLFPCFLSVCTLLLSALLSLSPMFWYNITTSPQQYEIVHCGKHVHNSHLSLSVPDSKVHEAHLGLTGPWWAPCWPQEPCYLGFHADKARLLSWGGSVVYLWSYLEPVFYLCICPSKVFNLERKFYISMALCKIIVSPLLMLRRYWNIGLFYRYSISSLEWLWFCWYIERKQAQTSH